MILHPAVIVHGLQDAKTALNRGLPVALLSAPGAALFAGGLWWRQVVTGARTAVPATDCMDILDCADSSGQAMAALRMGVSLLVLSPQSLGRHRVVEFAASQGGVVLAQPPPALDLSGPAALRSLEVWLQAPGHDTLHDLG
jgi:hypothetical protein